jgi:hypothetical protein
MNSFARYLSFALVLVVLRGFGQTAAAPTQPVAQTAPAQSASAKVEMPSDPAALLALAAKKNGLQNAGSAPWHLKATYELLDDKGAVKETGTFEEFWVSGNEYKLSYASPSFNQVVYSTKQGLFQSGSVRWPDGAASSVQEALFPALPSETALKKNKLGAADKRVGTADLKCVSIKYDSATAPSYINTYCFDRSLPALRIIGSTLGTNQSLFNDVRSFHGTYVARDTSISRFGKPFEKVHVDSLESQQAVEENVLALSSDARAVHNVSLATAVKVPGKIRHPASAECHLDAKPAGVQGTTVEVLALIKKDGSVADLAAVSGPPLLRKPAEDCVREWVFDPFLADGMPFEPTIAVDVRFRYLKCRRES